MDFNENVDLQLSVAEFNYLLMFLDNYSFRHEDDPALDSYMVQSIVRKLENKESEIYGK